MKPKILYLFLLVNLISCQNEKQTIITEIPKPIILNFSNMSGVKLITKIPCYIFENSKGLIIYNTYDSEGTFHIYEKNTGKLMAKLGKPGRGPNEFLSAMVIGESLLKNELYLLDPNLCNIYTVLPDSFPKFKINATKIINCQSYERIVKINENFLAGIHYDVNSKIEIFDKNGTVFSSISLIPFSEFPKLKVEIRLNYNEFDNILIAQSPDIGFMAAFKIDSVHLKLLWELHTKKPILRKTKNGVKLDKENNIPGFWEIKFYQGKIYALYISKPIKKAAGRRESLPQNLLIIDEFGRIEKNYELSEPLQIFNIVQTGNYILGTTIKNDDYQVVNAKISEN